MDTEELEEGVGVGRRNGTRGEWAGSLAGKFQELEPAPCVLSGVRYIFLQ